MFVSQRFISLLCRASVVLLAFAWPQPIHSGPTREVRRVLIINEVGTSYPLTVLTDQGIAKSLEGSPYRIEYYREYMDTALFPDPAAQANFRQFLIQKYQSRTPDVIITVGPSPLKLMLEIHREVFGHKPIVFCIPNTLPENLKFDPEFTGVGGEISPVGTLKAALRLQPATKHVVVVGGTGSFDLQQQEVIKSRLKGYEGRLEISYLTGLSMAALLDRLTSLPEHTVIFLTAISQDAEGAKFISSETGPMVVAAANAPVFSLSDRFFGHGEVGGDLSSAFKEGQIAGGMALRLLNGEKPEDIPVAESATAYTFDWRALRRWGYRENELPPGSTVLFRELSVWQRARWIWIGALLIIVALTAFAVYLHNSRKQLKLARDVQSQLSGLLINAQEKERRRLAAELHDDFSQRVALIVFGLGQAQDSLRSSSNCLHGKLQDLKQSASELGDDLHTVSHRLHSSTLETLGLVQGLRALCREFTARQNIEIDFSSEDVPPDAHPELGLCVFRIVQEALQNLKKHSEAAKAQVNLRRARNMLVLSVHDEGKGFNPDRLDSKMGLGIGSMQGRARLLGGQFEIRSEPGKGTTIEVWLPLQPELSPTEP